MRKFPDDVRARLFVAQMSAFLSTLRTGRMPYSLSIDMRLEI
ncbi:MAG TPA: hypothetical protein VGZ00_08075 [Candidatus Baltobacteraceae bacterium]|nr:hypothetical protein [Candidatus Baltobacteraceae bacterium]